MAEKQKSKPRKAASQAPPEPGWPYHRKGEPQRLKIEGSWEDAAKRLLEPAPDPTPKRKVKPRKAKKKPAK